MKDLEGCDLIGADSGNAGTISSHNVNRALRLLLLSYQTKPDGCDADTSKKTRADKALPSVMNLHRYQRLEPWSQLRNQSQAVCDVFPSLHFAYLTLAAPVLLLLLMPFRL